MGRYVHCGGWFFHLQHSYHHAGICRIVYLAYSLELLVSCRRLCVMIIDINIAVYVKNSSRTSSTNAMYVDLSTPWSIPNWTRLSINSNLQLHCASSQRVRGKHPGAYHHSIQYCALVCRNMRVNLLCWMALLPNSIENSIEIIAVRHLRFFDICTLPVL